MNKTLIIFLLLANFSRSQTMIFPEKLQGTMLAKLKSGDSLVYYQCHVEELAQQLSTASGQTLNTAPQKYTITEKYIITRDSVNYNARYLVSSMIILPNKRFSGLKIREKAYWNFKRVKEKTLTEKDLKILGALELKGTGATEYDFAVTKSNTNQVIIKQKKDFNQLNIAGNYVISKMIFE
jgi:hypothetical protein